jgi:Peptidase A4 family
MLSTHRLPGRRVLALFAISAPVAVAIGFAIDAPAASAHTVNTSVQHSQNWAGYIAKAPVGQSFSSVSGSWTEPSVSASSGPGYSSFWVGLGGASPKSQALEQIGTSADVVNGKPRYSAWYELIPAPETKISMAVHPGDAISASVTVNGTNVTMSLSDQTTGKSVTEALQTSNTDTSSAEWIAEAPSAPAPDGKLQILPLANFGAVTFTQASATAGGHTGSISDPSWTVQATQLTPSGGVGFPGGPTPGVAGQLSPSSGGASPSGLSDGGASFSVTYSAGAGAGG